MRYFIYPFNVVYVTIIHRPSYTLSRAFVVAAAVAIITVVIVFFFFFALVYQQCSVRHTEYNAVKQSIQCINEGGRK